jgi:hypothetical protein
MVPNKMVPGPISIKMGPGTIFRHHFTGTIFPSSKGINISIGEKSKK